MRSRQPIHVQPIRGRDLGCFAADHAALRALAQAAVNIELFTIPLYMVTMYSIQGTHEINASRQTFYKGRRWPGAATSSAPRTANERAFNLLFSVFIEEMLHLQLASNVASVLGVTPSFTSPMLQTPDYGWTCFGAEKSTIPHVVDLADTTTYSDVKVALGPLDRARIELLLAIEEPEAEAQRRIRPDKLDKYFPAVPFAGWTADKTEADLPLFGTIGYLYECLAAYMSLRYVDGSTLFSRVWTPGALQRDLFNTPSGSHPMAEYPGLPTIVATTDAEAALHAALDMLDAIADQGEGSKIHPTLRQRLTGRSDPRGEVEVDYRSSTKALAYDYPSYDAAGEPVASADAAARGPNDKIDHYQRFQQIKMHLLSDVITWDEWHARRGADPWTAQDLLSGPDEASPKIPRAEEVAAALNRLKHRPDIERQLSQVASGAIAGVTTVLDEFWRDPTRKFPFPAMGGSGDRVSICWAVLGKAPNLATGIARKVHGRLYHACQGLDFTQPGEATMPAVAVYHNCIGSNHCRGEGGCGFVQSVKGGGSCSGSGGGGGGCSTKSGGKNGCNPVATDYSAPADNKCAGFGGCAVPISASQLFPKSGQMELFDLTADTPKSVGAQPFAAGEPVYETAWKAYCAVLAKAGHTPPDAPPAADDLRLAFPPST